MSPLATQFVREKHINIWIIVTFIMTVKEIYTQKLYAICKILSWKTTFSPPIS